MLDSNKITFIPEYVSELDPKYLSISRNFLTKITQEFVSFRNLREIDLSFNKISTFLDRLTQSEISAAAENFISVTSLNLCNNQFSSLPMSICLFQNLKILNVSYNQLSDLSNLCSKERTNETIEAVDFSNNYITSVPSNIWKLQRIHSINLENNNIKDFSPEIGLLNLKNLTIAGNPSLLIKNKVSKNTVTLLAYLRDRLPQNLKEIEQEIFEIQQRFSGQAPKQKREKIPEYEFNDPFKAKVDTYNKKEYDKYSGIDSFRTDTMKSYSAGRMDEEVFAGPAQKFQNSLYSYQEPQKPHFPNSQDVYSQNQGYGKSTPFQQGYNQSNQWTPEETNYHRNQIPNQAYQSSQNQQYQNFGQQNYQPVTKTEPYQQGNFSQNNYGMTQQSNQQSQMSLVEYERQISDLQYELDNDLNTNRVIKMQKRRDLNKLMSEKNQLYKR